MPKPRRKPHVTTRRPTTVVMMATRKEIRPPLRREASLTAVREARESRTGRWRKAARWQGENAGGPYVAEAPGAAVRSGVPSGAIIGWRRIIDAAYEPRRLGDL